MIEDPSRVSIPVTADDSVVSSDKSISLGLIVTELVINALKHAFPGDRHGRISVRYQGRGPNWALSVDDDGVGMSDDPETAKPGLGTSIVEALAAQLQAEVQIGNARPGTTVEIAHSDLVVVRDPVAQAV
jgi:two-component sensor histidine kinase